MTKIDIKYGENQQIMFGVNFLIAKKYKINLGVYKIN
jgi:hypothetical protein